MTGITINTTVKSGWINLKLNDYYNGLNGDYEHFSRVEGVAGLCLGKMDGVEYVEIHLEHEQDPYYLTWEEITNGTIKLCSSVNGVAPTSITDLKDKLLALL